MLQRIACGGQGTSILRRQGIEALARTRPVDHEVEFKCEAYQNGRAVADPETPRRLARFFRASGKSRDGTASRHDPIDSSWEGRRRSTYQRVTDFLKSTTRLHKHTGCLLTASWRNRARLWPADFLTAARCETAQHVYSWQPGKAEQIVYTAKIQVGTMNQLLSVERCRASVNW